MDERQIKVTLVVSKIVSSYSDSLVFWPLLCDICFSIHISAIAMTFDVNGASVFVVSVRR